MLPRRWLGANRGANQSIIYFPRHGEAVEHRRRQIQALIILKTVGRGVDVALRGSDDAVVITRYSLNLDGVGVEEPLLNHDGEFFNSIQHYCEDADVS